jgi:hypothetical protein
LFIIKGEWVHVSEDLKTACMTPNRRKQFIERSESGKTRVMMDNLQEDFEELRKIMIYI